MNVNKHEYTMELLAAMTASEIAKRHNISKLQAFDKFIQSKTADMLFDDELNFWWNGPDYLADEYEKASRSADRLWGENRLDAIRE